MKLPKVICTIGPGSNNPETLAKLKERGVNFFRINLSHTPREDIEQRVKDLLGYDVPIILDTEGLQIRSGNTEEIEFKADQIVKVHTTSADCDAENIYLTPPSIVAKLQEGDLISIDFNSLLMRVFDTTTVDQGFIKCKVIIPGLIGGRKAVHIDSPSLHLPPFSQKDHKAIECAKKYKVKYFTLSFMEDPSWVRKFKELYPEATVYAKIESQKGLDNFREIAEEADGILIDRGDMSNQVDLEMIPFVQKKLIKEVREMGKEVFIATNTLEQMALALKPNRAEVNDIINTLLDGATGIALTKETAVGKYPVQTANMLINLINQLDFVGASGHDDVLEKIEESSYLSAKNRPELLVQPHGGTLVDRWNPSYSEGMPEKTIEVDDETMMDVEQIAVGAFSPIEGFLNSDDFNSVANTMRLTNGVIWTLPIILDVSEEEKQGLVEGQDIAITFKGEPHALLHLEEVYKIDDKEAAAQKIYGTTSQEHPGVKKFVETKEYFLGGKITLLKRKDSEYKLHELTPRQTRKIFAERGWSKVVGFHTRNVIHRSHEFIQLEAMRKGLCDGLFVHPVIGKKKPGDFESTVIIESYEKMMESIYPRSKVVFGTFATYSRYGGPREALFTAVVRKNFGCSHFIVGRDHTGVKDFYHPHDSHKIFSAFSQEELGIEPVLYDEVFYSALEEKHLHEPDFIDHPENDKLSISGTQARELLKAGKQPPNWFMRPEISELIIEKVKAGEKVFVE